MFQGFKQYKASGALCVYSSVFRISKVLLGSRSDWFLIIIVHGVTDHARECKLLLTLPNSTEIPVHRLSKIQCNSFTIHLFKHSVFK